MKQVAGEEPEARLPRRRAVIVHGGQRALRDEDRELAILVGRAVDRLPEDGRRDRHRPVVGSGLDELRPAGYAESRYPPLYSGLHALPHGATRRPRPPILKYRASVTASTVPMRTLASSGTRTRAHRRSSAH